MENTEYLWRTYDDKHKLLGTLIPNCFYQDLLRNFTGSELKIILFICRMSYGFNRETTNNLSYGDFKKATGVDNVSRTMGKLLKNQIIFNGFKSNSNKECQYAVNLLPYGVKMKSYYIKDENTKLDSDDCVIGMARYQFGSILPKENDVIVYVPKSSAKKEKVYIK